MVSPSPRSYGHVGFFRHEHTNSDVGPQRARVSFEPRWPTLDEFVWHNATVLPYSAIVGVCFAFVAGSEVGLGRMPERCSPALSIRCSRYRRFPLTRRPKKPGALLGRQVASGRRAGLNGNQSTGHMLPLTRPWRIPYCWAARNPRQSSPSQVRLMTSLRRSRKRRM